MDLEVKDILKKISWGNILAKEYVVFTYIAEEKTAIVAEYNKLKEIIGEEELEANELYPVNRDIVKGAELRQYLSNAKEFITAIYPDIKSVKELYKEPITDNNSKQPEQSEQSTTIVDNSEQSEQLEQSKEIVDNSEQSKTIVSNKSYQEQHLIEAVEKKKEQEEIKEEVEIKQEEIKEKIKEEIKEESTIKIEPKSLAKSELSELLQLLYSISTSGNKEDNAKQLRRKVVKEATNNLGLSLTEGTIDMLVVIVEKERENNASFTYQLFHEVMHVLREKGKS